MANSARIDELRKKFDENPRRYFAPLANEYRKSGDLAQAVFILEEYLPQQQGHISGHIVYGQTLFELGRDEEAKRVFETALSLDPENLIALRHLGHISRQAGDFEAARSWYQRLLEADPRDAEIEQLLGSLDSAAQAHAASIAHPAVDSVPPPLPPPAPVAEPDDTPFMIERIVEHDAPGAPAREATHPLAPPPLPEPAPAALEAAAAPAEPVEPPPLPQAVAEEPQAAEPEPAHELLDLNDFSFESPAGEPPVDAVPVAAEQDASHESPSQPEEEAEFEVPAAPQRNEEPWNEPPSETTSDVEASADAAAEADSLPPDVPVGFEPFSGLESQASEEEPEQVGGLETYTFESPQGAAGEPTEDVSSFYIDGTYSTPTEPVEPAEGFESVEMEFAADVAEAASDEPPPAASVPEISTPIAASTPVAASMPIAASTPISEEPVVAPPPAADAETDAFATETMAKLYMSQGHLESALGIYRTLAAKRPDDPSLRTRIEEIEDRVQRRRREPTPPAPMDATPSAYATPVASIAAPSPEEAPAPARPSGPTIRDFLLGIIRRAGTSAAPSAGSNGGTIDALFGAGEALDDDLVAADTLAQAFAPDAEADTDPLQGKPTREAASELSLDSVFRQPTAAHAADHASAGFSFDQFFAGDRAEDLGAPAPPSEPDDIEQFNAWLNGLKKS